MMPIRLRWPLMVATLLGVGYLGQHYTISGLEHLTLAARQPPADGKSESRLAVSAWNFDAQSTKLPSTASSAMALSPPPSTWQDNLSLGEKVALWQNGQNLQGTQPTQDHALPSTPQLPVTTPIPLPPGIATDHDLSRSNNLAQGNAAVGSAAGLASPPSGSPAMSQVPAGNMTSVRRPAEATSRSAARHSVIRVGSFNTQSFGPSKLVNPQALETLVSIIQQFDVTALQEIQSARDDILPLIMDRLNQTGRRYDYLIGPRVGRVPPHQQFAFVFDTERLETDRFQLYTVDDPDDLLAYEPLVAWFRCRGVPTKQAFTFSLVTLQLDPDMGEAELALLPQLFQALQSDGRGEDDIIVAGDFNAGTDQLSRMLPQAARFAVQEQPTTVDGTRMLDTLFFSAQATSEFTGRAGVSDFLRDRNLSIERALEVSDHLPVWAEFSITEGAEPGRVAPLDPRSVF